MVWGVGRNLSPTENPTVSASGSTPTSARSQRYDIHAYQQSLFVPLYLQQKALTSRSYRRTLCGHIVQVCSPHSIDCAVLAWCASMETTAWNCRFPAAGRQGIKVTCLVSTLSCSISLRCNSTDPIFSKRSTSARPHDAPRADGR